ncbi:uncharacterized protein LOC122849216 [Aphidius gifuensis]|uniref:uncharacterized protein LOC122849216 n=1 Tax=Aphidius gifuensis TaxID=684658 RepID=UPI001CDCB285|nr:uncharacterized protein LOC122849216 [Aphidius gifuensis]
MNEYNINFDTRLSNQPFTMEKVIVDIHHKLQVEKNKIEEINKQYGSLKQSVIRGDIDTSSSLLNQWLKADRRNDGVNPHGRRWSVEEKLNSLSLYRRGPRLYRQLLKKLPNSLPSARTIGKISSAISFGPGLNNNLLEAVASQVKSMQPIDLNCILCYDEMSVRPRYFYDSHSDNIIGHQDYGNDLPEHNTGSEAKKALLFLLQGLHKPWKLPIAYYFNDGKMIGEDLQKLILKIIGAVHKIGLKVRATNSDQGGPNRTAVNSMKVCDVNGIKHQYFEVMNNDVIQKVYVLFDVPHMLKNFRNNWLGSLDHRLKDRHFDEYYNSYTGNIVILGDIVGKWEYLVKLFSLRYNSGDPGISKTMMFPRSRDKMRVYLATKLLSQTTANHLRDPEFHQELRKMDNFKEEDIQGAKDTATVVEFFDRLADFTNGPSTKELKNPKKPSKILVSKSSPHLEKWEEFLTQFEKIKFVQQDGTVCNVHSVEGFKSTLKGLIGLWRDLKDNDNFEELNLRHVNQDCVENCFGRIRSISGDNDHPTVLGFTSGFCSLLVTDFSAEPIEGTNCEPDNIPLLVNQADLLLTGNRKDENNNINITNNNDKCGIETEDYFGDRLRLAGYESDEDDIVDNITKSPHLSVQIIATAVLKQLNFLKCSDCASCFTTAMSSNSSYCEASPDFKHTIQRVMKIFNENIDKMFHTGSVASKLSRQFELYLNMNWLSCPSSDHAIDIKNQLFHQLAIVLIKRYCRLKSNKQIEEENKSKNARKIGQQKINVKSDGTNSNINKENLFHSLDGSHLQFDPNRKKVLKQPLSNSTNSQKRKISNQPLTAVPVKRIKPNILAPPSINLNSNQPLLLRTYAPAKQRVNVTGVIHSNNKIDPHTQQKVVQNAQRQITLTTQNQTPGKIIFRPINNQTVKSNQTPVTIILKQMNHQTLLPNEASRQIILKPFNPKK